jgi:hypothetical protein
MGNSVHYVLYKYNSNDLGIYMDVRGHNKNPQEIQTIGLSNIILVFKKKVFGS